MQAHCCSQQVEVEVLVCITWLLIVLQGFLYNKLEGHCSLLASPVFGQVSQQLRDALQCNTAMMMLQKSDQVRLLMHVVCRKPHIF
jgi:hypothetical protein